MASRARHMHDSDTCLDIKTLKFRFLYLDAYRHAYNPIIVDGNLINTVGV